MRKLLTLVMVSVLIMTSGFVWFDNLGGAEDDAITLAWDFNLKKPVFEKVIEEYNKLNGSVKLKLDQKEGSTYTSWLSNQLTLDDASADIVIATGVDKYFSQGKFVDLSQYLNKPNPYTNNEIWKTVMNDVCYESPAGFSNGEVFCLNTEQVITSWFYNKDLFDELGVVEYVGKEPTEWNFDDLIKACELIKSNGITPLAIGGDYQSLWSYQLGWFYRVYTDQYFRDQETTIIAQPGDYCYDAELQSEWFFDMDDVSNDNEEGYIVNLLRLFNMLSNGETGPDTVKFKEMITNLSRLIPEYVPQGFSAISPSDAANLFIQGDAAIYIDQISFYAGIERTFEDYGENSFEIGVFRYPPMTGENVSVDYTRDTGGARGGYAIIAKDKERTEAAVDFLMYFISPAGQTVYLKALESENIAPSGVPLVNDVEMPEKWKGKYDFEFPGSADSNKFAAFSRGLYDHQESVRDYVEISQTYFSDGIDLDEYCLRLQRNCVKYIPYVLRNLGYKTDAYKTPSLDPKEN